MRLMFSSFESSPIHARMRGMAYGAHTNGGVSNIETSSGMDTKEHAPCNNFVLLLTFNFNDAQSRLISSNPKSRSAAFTS